VGGNSPNADWRRGIGRGVIWVKAEIAHQRVENSDLVGREDIDRRAVGGVADRDVLAGQGPLARRPAESPAQARADGVVVICGPGVVGAGVDYGKCARDHRRPELRVANPLEGTLAPTADAATGQSADLAEKSRT